MRNECGISRWEGSLIVLVLSILGLGDAAAKPPWANSNQSLQISGTPPTSAVVDKPYSFRPTASSDGDHRLWFWISSQPAWATFDTGTGELRGTPTVAGTYPDIVIGVRDGGSAWHTSVALEPFTIRVDDTGERVNEPPLIGGTPAGTVVTGTTYAFQPSASDPEGAILSFAVQNRPAWAGFDASTGRLSGTPSSTHVGSYGNIVISVTDGVSFASLAPFAIEVTAASNAAPVISGSPATQVAAGQSYAFTPSASDADGDVLTFTIQNRPAWATFSPTTGRLSGTPTTAQAGAYADILIAVSDGNASASLPAFTIAVEQPATQSVTLSWQAPTLNEDGTPLTDLTGYEVRYGESAGQYSQTLSLPSAALTSVTIEDLAPATWYFAVKAVNSAGTQSSFSNEAWKTIY